MMTPLPRVELVCSMIQQEESQREVCMSEKNEPEISVVYSRDLDMCKTCGMKGHASDLCLTVVGYPKQHPKHKNYGGNLNDNRSREQGGRYNNRSARVHYNRGGKAQQYGVGSMTAANA